MLPCSMSDWMMQCRCLQILGGCQPSPQNLGGLRLMSGYGCEQISLDEGSAPKDIVCNVVPTALCESAFDWHLAFRQGYEVNRLINASERLKYAV